MHRFLVVVVMTCMVALAMSTYPVRVSDCDFDIPGQDRFVPFAKTVSVGSVVTWHNGDEDSHTVDSVDRYNTIGPKNLNYILKPGQSLSIKFNKPGLFIFRCAFHSKLSDTDQPIAPGPMGGIQDANGNFGTPMMGILHIEDNKDSGKGGYGQRDGGYGHGGYPYDGGYGLGGAHYGGYGQVGGYNGGYNHGAGYNGGGYGGGNAGGYGGGFGY